MPPSSSPQSRASSSSQGRTKKSSTSPPAQQGPPAQQAPSTPFDHPRENLHDVVVPRIVTGFEPIRGLTTNDLRNLRLTHPRFRTLLNTGAAWEHVYARNALVRILWKAKEQNIRWVIETQSMKIDEGDSAVNADSEAEVLYMKNRFTPNGARYITYDRAFGTVSDVTDNFIQTLDSRAGIHKVVRESVKAILREEHNATDVYLKDELMSIQKPFYLNIYLPGVRAENREDFLDEFELFADRYNFDLENEGITGAELSFMKEVMYEWVVLQNPQEGGADEHDSDMFPFYINIFFGPQKPKYSKSIRRVLKGCRLRTYM